MRSSFSKAIVIALLSSFVATAAAVGAAWSWIDREILTDLPTNLSDYRSYRPDTACELFDKDGKSFDSFYLERRYWVPLSELPDHVWQAFVAAEDQHFYDHKGIDLVGILRAVVANYRAGDSVQGASTLTQQLVKNLLLNREKSLERKVKEAILAFRLEKELTKDQILQLYLNFVFLGSGNYGVEAAARDYYGVSARQLGIGEAALIAGLVPAPSRYSPRRNSELAKWRRSLVLGRMVQEGWVDAKEIPNFEDDPTVRAAHVGGEDLGDATAYATTVRREVRRLFGEEAHRKGLKVKTPFDPQIQSAAVSAMDKLVEAHLARQGPRAVVDRTYDGSPPHDPAESEACFVVQVPWNRRLDELLTASQRWTLVSSDYGMIVFDERELGRGRPLASQLGGGELLGVCRDDSASDAVRIDVRPWAQAAAVVIENRSGQVIALTGGTDLTLEGFVRAVQAKRQPGSSFKPYVYATALASGRNQLDIYYDAPIALPSGNGSMWSPKNYGGGYSGPVTMRQALSRSLNTVSVRMTLEAGPTEVVRLAQALGVKTPLRNDLTLALGSSEVTPLDQAVGYASIARLGVPIEPRFVDSVSDGDGILVAEAGQTVQLQGRTVTMPGAPGERALEPEVAYQLLDIMREVVRGGTAKKAYVAGYDRAGKTGTTNNCVDAWYVGMTPRYTVAVWIGTDGSGTLGDKETGGKSALPGWIEIMDALPDQKGLEFSVPDEAVRIATENGLLGFARGRVPTKVLSRVYATPGPLPPLPN